MTSVALRAGNVPVNRPYAAGSVGHWQPPHDRRDLSNYLSVNSVLELPRTERSARISANHEIALMQCAGTAQIAAIPFENKVEELFASVRGCTSNGFFDPAVDDDEGGIDEPRVDWRFIPTHPKHIRKREVPEGSDLTQ